MLSVTSSIMESPLLSFGLVLFLLFLFATWLNSVLENRRHARKAAEWGCKPASMMPTRLPLGLDFLCRLVLWDRANMLPPFTYQLYKEMGVPTWEQNFLGINAFVTIDPKNIQAVLATQFHDFDLGSTRRGNFFPLLGNGIFTSDGKDWEHSRAMLRPQFAREQIADLDSFEFHSNHFFMHLPVRSDGWTDQVNMQPILSRMVMDAATEFLCGDSVYAQVIALPDTPENKEFKATFRQGSLDWTRFAEYFDDATKALGVRIRMFDRYYLYSPPSFHRQCKEVHRFMDYYVQKALALNLKHDSENDVEKDATHKQKYVFLNELTKETRDPIELRSQLLNVLLAGRDTTAGTMSWLFFNLARHPRVFDKLRAAIIQDFGTASQSKRITFESLKACTYLQYVINETLRLYPNVAMNSRRATRDTTLPRGGGPRGEFPVYIRKRQEINYYVIAMHRRKDLWGEDSEDFVPERWEGKKRGWEYLPFNGGPRICLGQQFALTEAGFMLVRTLQKFDRIDNMDPDPEIRHTYTVTTTPKQVLIRMHAATQV